MKKTRGPIISKSEAIRIAMDWHSGQWSPFYSFASSGIYDDGRYQDYVRECDVELASVINRSQRRELENLKRWFDYKHYESIEGLSGMRLELLGGIEGMGRAATMLTTNPYAITRAYLQTKPSLSVSTDLPVIETTTPVKATEIKPMYTEPLITLTPLAVPPIEVTPHIEPVLIPTLDPVKPVTFIEKVTDVVKTATDVITKTKQNLTPQTSSTVPATESKKEASVSVSTGIMIASLGGAAILTGLIIARSKKRRRSGMGRIKKSRKRKRARR